MLASNTLAQAVPVDMAPKLSQRPASPQAVLDLFKVHVSAQQLASARSTPGQWFDCSTDKERYCFLEVYQGLVEAIIDLDPYVLKSTLDEVFVQLNQWQDGRLAGKDVDSWSRAQAYHFRNLLALSRKVASRCTTGLRLPAAVRSMVEHLRQQKTVSSTRRLLKRRSSEEVPVRQALPSLPSGSQQVPGQPTVSKQSNSTKAIWALYGLPVPAGLEVQDIPSSQEDPMLINSSQEMEAPSCSTMLPSLPQGLTYWDAHLGTVVHRSSEGLIKAKTIAGPEGFLVGTFEGFNAEPFVTEVPNLALEKSKSKPSHMDKKEQRTRQKKEQGRQKKNKNKKNNKKKQQRKQKDQDKQQKGQRKRQAPALQDFRLTKASDKWYICQRDEQGNFVHMVSVYQRKCPRFAQVAQEIFDHLQSHPSTSKEEVLAMRDRLQQ